MPSNILFNETPEDWLDLTPNSVQFKTLFCLNSSLQWGSVHVCKLPLWFLSFSSFSPYPKMWLSPNSSCATDCISNAHKYCLWTSCVCHHFWCCFFFITVMLSWLILILHPTRFTVYCINHSLSVLLLNPLLKLAKLCIMSLPSLTYTTFKIRVDFPNQSGWAGGGHWWWDSEIEMIE